MSVLERRARLSATLSSGSDAGLLVPDDLGPRLAGLRFDTQTNLGFGPLRADILAPSGGSQRLLHAEAEVIYYTWPGGILRIYADARLVWMGRLLAPDVGEFEREPTGETAIASIEGDGTWFDLTNEPGFVDSEWSAEDATVSATELVRAQIERHGGLIQPRFGNVAAVGANLGPLSISFDQTAYDLIILAARMANENEQESYFAVWDPADGPVFQSRGTGAVRWAPSATGGGLRVRRDLREFASACIVQYTTGDGSTGVTEPVVDPSAPDLANGMRRTRVVNADRAGPDGGITVARAYLHLHRDPFGLTPLAIRPRDGELFGMIDSLDGGRFPAYVVRAQEVCDVRDVLPFSPRLNDLGGLGRLMPVEQTSVDWDSGETTITFDQRRLRSRLDEDPGAVGVLLRALEPGMSRKLLAQGKSTDDVPAIASGVNTEITDAEIIIAITRPTQIHITISLKYTAVSTTPDIIWLGYSLDNEEWDHLDEDVSAQFDEPALNGASTSRGWTFFRDVQPGAYTVRTWFRQENGPDYTVQKATTVVRG